MHDRSWSWGTLLSLGLRHKFQGLVPCCTRTCEEQRISTCEHERAFGRGLQDGRDSEP